MLASGSISIRLLPLQFISVNSGEEIALVTLEQDVASRRFELVDRLRESKRHRRVFPLTLFQSGHSFEAASVFPVRRHHCLEPREEKGGLWSV